MNNPGTWEPLSSFMETEALDRYEVIHGNMADSSGGEKGGVVTG
jgi:hypothetical protein